MTHEAQRTACLPSENFPQILGKFETKHFAMHWLQVPPIPLTLHKPSKRLLCMDISGSAGMPAQDFAAAGTPFAHNAPFTMAANDGAFRRRRRHFCHRGAVVPVSLIHSLNAGCEFQTNKNDLQSRGCHDRVRVR
jgi:hypothetical protein